MKAWTYSITVPELLNKLLFWQLLETVKPTITFPETVEVLTETGDLIVYWPDSLIVTEPTGQTYTFKIPQIEKPHFAPPYKPDPFAWVAPAAVGAGAGIVLGLVLDLVLSKK
jgi:hypothetical protein